MSSPRDIVLAALGFSGLNKPLQIAPDAEMLDVVTRAARGCWAYAARLNPEFFGAQAAVVYAGAGWARPADAELVWYIENPAGQEVIVVPRNDLQADASRPAVWSLTQVYRPIPAYAPGPVAANALTVFYSQIFPKPATIDTPITALWPTQFDDLLVHETAMYFALKDRRADERGVIEAGRDHWAQLFAAFLEHETTPRVYRYGAPRTFNVPALIAAHLAPAA